MTLRTRTLLLLVPMIVAAAIGLACGSEDGQGDASTIPSPTETSTSTPEPTVDATASSTETPTATPTPYAGDVARLEIPRFDVVSDIEDVGVTNNQMDTPEDPHNTAFYHPDITGWGGNEFLPGWAGNALFSAHVDYWPDILGPFHELANMEPGDEVHIVMDDGTEYTYEVIGQPESYPASEFPTGEIIDAPERPEGADWITLITCGGDLDRDRPGGPGDYTDRIVVVAERVS